MSSLENNQNELSGAEQKVNEYVERINKGESIESVMQGLPSTFRDAIEKKLLVKEQQQGDGFEQKELAIIPPQYEGLDAESLDFIWDVKEYVDPVKTAQEKERKAKALAYLREQETGAEKRQEGKLNDQKEIEAIKDRLGIEKEDPFKKKEVEHTFGDHEQAVGIYNTLMDLGKGLSEGRKEEFERKIEYYANKIRSGEDKEYVLSNMGEKWRKAIEERLAREPLNELTTEKIIESLEFKIKDNLDSLSQTEIKEQIKLQHDLVRWKHKTTLGDDLFSVGKGHMYEDEKGNFHTWEAIEGQIGERFDAHGVAKKEQLSDLLNLLDNGIDSSRVFYTAPFELSEEDKIALAAALGTGDGTAYKDGIAVVTSGIDQTLLKDGIKLVFLNDVYQSLKGPLIKLYPQYQFHLLSEQKAILEREVRG